MRCWIDERGPEPVLRYPEEFVRDHHGVPGLPFIALPEALVRSAFRARSDPLPTGEILDLLLFECMNGFGRETAAERPSGWPIEL